MEKIFKGFRKNERVDLTNEQMINFFLYVVIFGLPYVYSPYGGNTYNFPKAIFLWTISIIIIILYIRNNDFKINKICKVAVLYCVCICITIMFSQDIHRSIFGDVWRYEGLITILSYVVLFIATSKYLKLSKKIIDIFIILGTVMSIYGIFQFFGFNLVKESINNLGMYSSHGFIGNRNFFSSYIIIFLSLSSCLFIFFRQNRYLVFSSIAFGALLCAQTRGGWIAFLFSILILFIYSMKKVIYVKQFVVLIFSFTIIFSVLGRVRDNEIIKRFSSMINNVYYTMLSLDNIKEDSNTEVDNLGSGRVGIWKVSYKVFKKYPITGCGLENLDKSIINDFPEWNEEWIEQMNSRVDRAHNEILHLAATTGILGVIPYCILIFMVIVKILKNINDNRFKVIFVIIISYLIQAMFNISVVGVAPIFWIILGIASNPKIIKEINL